ncbi:MAG TPA: hypothetical protein VE842_05415 [Pyrinomonadaceae bacterium]|jgi:hypothetical protein|nr:hypothetical protein [Pyrinomonadaceae bacterium]
MTQLLNHTGALRGPIIPLLFVILCFAPATLLAQSSSSSGGVKDAVQQPQTAEARAEQILQRAIDAVGGASYLNVRTIIGRGLYTPYKDGVSGIPVAFVDYIAYPDRERTEFRGEGVRNIQANTGASGWVYDGVARTIKDMTPEQVEDFRFTIRTSVENLLRGGWRKEGAKLSYVGRREAGVGRRNETVRLSYPDGTSVEFEFGAKDSLPAKVIYQRKDADGKDVTEEDRLAQYINVGGGHLAPFVIDHFRAGLQTSRINYESIEVNAPLADSLFARPANAKAVK